MAKKSTKSAKTNTNAKIIRNYDIFSMEKRVYDMDNSPRRSYDLYSLEERIYQLEKNGGGGGGIPQFNVIQGPVESTSDISGTVTAKDFYPGFPAENAFLTNSGWIAYSADSYWQYEMSEVHKVNMITWDVTDTNRNQVPTGYMVSYDGETFTDVTPTYVGNKILMAFTENPIKAFRILFTGLYSSSTFPMMSNTTVKGE